ncbi:MAG: hypothetical protein H2069_01985 [Legionella sp.]|nr:hypothetical protein [Legionella sp.]
MFKKSETIKGHMAIRKERPPVPDLIYPYKEDPLSKRLRRFSNVNITKPHYSDMVYLGTNENYKESFAKLSKINRVNDGCHFGFSSWHNFDIAAQRRSNRIIICDINPENALFLHETLQILRDAKDSRDFIRKMIDYVKENEFITADGKCINKDFSKSIFFSDNVSDNEIYREIKSLEDELNIELIRPLSWVSDANSFNHIKKLANLDRIVLLTEDICTTETFIKITNLLKDNGVQIDSLYLSNIADALRGECRKKFVKTVEILSPGAVTIHAPDCQQRILSSKISSPIELQRELYPKDLYPTLTLFKDSPNKTKTNETAQSTLAAQEDAMNSTTSRYSFKF